MGRLKNSAALQCRVIEPYPERVPWGTTEGRRWRVQLSRASGTPRVAHRAFPPV